MMRWWRLLMPVMVVAVIASSLAGSVGNRASASAANELGYGALANDFGATKGMGFNWVKIFASWAELEPAANSYSSGNFSALSSAVEAARGRGLKVLLQISHAPSWATGSADGTTPPINDGDLANFMGYLGGYFTGRVAAYEIWNEPNLRGEWGMQQPDPVKFASMLRALYPKIKAADPQALVVTGGLSTTGDGIGYWSYGDLLWIRDLYVLGNVKSCSDGSGGLRSCFDAIGSHPYGGPFAPETDPSVAQYTVGLYFRRAEQQKQMMDVWGQDYNNGVFATEFNWLLNPAAFGVNCSWGSPWPSYWLSGTASEQEARQADYLVRAFNYAYSNWPWMRGMIVFNLDFQAGRSICDQVTWLSLTRPDGTRRPAYYSLANMAKPGILPPILRLSASDATFMVSPNGTDSRIFRVSNAGSGSLAWAASSSAAWMTLTGAGTSQITVLVNSHGLANGTYSGTVTVSGASGTQNSPQQIHVRMYVGSIYRSSITTVQKNTP